MLDYRYNEYTYAKNILDRGFTSNYIKHEMQILAKFYKYLGETPKEREKSLYDFSSKNIKDFDRATHFKIVNSALNYARKKENVLVEIESVEISDKELDLIDSIPLDHVHKKVAFSLLVIDKLSKETQRIRDESSVSNEHYYGGSTKKYRELTNTSKIPLVRNKKRKDIHSIISDMSDLGLVEIKNKGFIKLNFLYNIEDSENSVMEVSTYDDIGFYYDYYRGENRVKKCEKCGRFFKAKNAKSYNSKKYCETCAKEKERQRVRLLRMNLNENENS
ncbi:hypothetical protein PQ478_08555 [Alkalihalophilus pseudofirmus]|uniref:hypothetical protein n=1 Tax=Alkalihalophilus pseudofirmus TaxID=79885 RepID=UPI00259BCE1A|nr:hypothetical protein [Alkalihalophilus pseudofirmus]WEG18519.1 hypothetical protein PQ478_08555 [Alkalihalophilus pseudofirmus]